MKPISNKLKENRFNRIWSNVRHIVDVGDWIKVHNYLIMTNHGYITNRLLRELSDYVENTKVP